MRNMPNRSPQPTLFSWANIVRYWFAAASVSDTVFGAFCSAVAEGAEDDLVAETEAVTIGAVEDVSVLKADEVPAVEVQDGVVVVTTADEVPALGTRGWLSNRRAS